MYHMEPTARKWKKIKKSIFSEVLVTVWGMCGVSPEGLIVVEWFTR